MANSKDESQARRIAQVLVDAVYMGDVGAAKKWDITNKTVQNYWKKLESDDGSISNYFHLEEQRRSEAWAVAMDEALEKAAGFIVKATEEANPKDAGVINAISGAYQVLADAKIAREMIHARISAQSGTQAQPSKQVVAGVFGQLQQSRAQA